MDWPHGHPPPWMSTLDHLLEAVQSPKSLQKAESWTVCLFLLPAEGTEVCWRSGLASSALGSPSGSRPSGHCERMRGLVTLLGFGPAFFILRKVCSVSQVLCPKNETLEWRNYILFYLQRLIFLSLEHFSQNLHEPSPLATYILDDLDGDLKDIKLEHHFWTPLLLNSHGNMVVGFRDFTLIFGSMPAWQIPLLPVGPAVPASSFTQNEVIVFVVK